MRQLNLLDAPYSTTEAPPRERIATHVFADGGVIGRNPSAIGGTYAWCHVANHARIASGSGVIRPGDLGVAGITNNISELYALCAGLIALPRLWTGAVCSDSKISLGRLFWQWKLNNVPLPLLDMMKRALRNIDAPGCQPVLHDGHPTRIQLRAGRGKRGNPVSVHNVWCDHECTKEAERIKARL